MSLFWSSFLIFSAFFKVSFTKKTPLFRRCTLHDEGGNGFCRLPEPTTFEFPTKYQKAIECANVCNLLNSQQPSYEHQSVFNYNSYYSKFTNSYPSVNLKVIENYPKKLVDVSYDLFNLTLFDYPPIPTYEFTSSYNACSGFNFLHDSALCQLFPYTNETGIVSISSNLNSCSYYKKIVYGPCYLKAYQDDCDDVPGVNEADNGIYWISINNVIRPTYCYFTGGKKYTVFQKRVGNDVGFNRDWQGYKTGFGDPKNSFWLGNELIHNLTTTRAYTMRVYIENFSGVSSYQDYTDFHLESESLQYVVNFNGNSGTAGNGLEYNMKFSTKDVKNDNHLTLHCSIKYSCGWWYNGCHIGILNGLYLEPGSPLLAEFGICWFDYTILLRKSVMMLTRA